MPHDGLRAPADTAMACPSAKLPLRVALLGFGAIGRSLAQALLLYPDQMTLVAILVRPPAQPAADAPDRPAPFAASMVFDREALLAAQPDVVVECAGHDAVDAHAEWLLRAGCDLLLLSVGALADDERRRRLAEAAGASGRQVVIASGAIGGIDWLMAARHAGLRQVVYRGRKPPAAWKGSPADDAVDLDALAQPMLLFAGTAAQAASRYPRNANVAATVALATLGMTRTMVELWADPGITENRHEIDALGSAGRLQLMLENRADPANPRSSVITAHSALQALLRRRTALTL